MKTLTETTRAPLTRGDLLAEGFTTAQISALEDMKAYCPYVEFFDSRKDIERLRFMKWMINRKSAILA